MRRLFVTAFIVMTMALGAPLVHGGNQEEANRIAEHISVAYPQYQIEVAYKDGKVRLRGEVANEMDRQGIVQMVQRIPNVQTVSGASVMISKNSQDMNQNFGMAYNAMNTNSEIQMVSATQTMPAVPMAHQASQNVQETDPNMIPGVNPLLVAQTVDANGNPISSSMVTTTDAKNPVPPASGNEFKMYSSMETAPIQGEPSVPMSNMVDNRVISANVGMNMEGNYSSAPMGTPIQAGHNGQNGEPNLPNYAWPTTADYPNYSQVSYPKQYAAGAFPYIGPFYPYPQVPLGWRKVTMEWHDGYWWLDFNDGSANGPFSPLFRQPTKYR